MHKYRLALFAVALGVLGFACARLAHADPTLPPDPLQDPKAAFDSFAALYHVGWPVTVLAGIVVAARLVGRFAPRFTWLNGKPAAVVAAVASIGAAAFDVLALGGSWASVVGAVAVSAAALWHPEPKKPATDGGAA